MFSQFKPCKRNFPARILVSRLFSIICQHYMLRELLGIAVLALPATLPASAQSCAVSCANLCGPRADYPSAASYNKCIQTCSTKCRACQASNKAPGFVYPKFYVAGLFYAPPGCTKTATAACSTQSTVDYQNGSSTGTKISTSDSYQSGVDVKVDATLGLGDQGKAGQFGLSGSFGYSTTDTDTTSESLTKSSTLEEKATGNQDGIDHDQDKFLLLLNPAVAVGTVHNFATGVCATNGVAWNFGVNTKLAPTQVLFTVSLGDLKNPSSMPAAVATQLSQLKFTNADYQTILGLDPFASNPTASPAALDQTRFVPTTITFPYERPDQSAECNAGICTCFSIQAAIKNDFQTGAGTESKSEYKVGMSESTGFNAGVFKFGETADLSFVWTSTSTQDDITGSTQTATLNVQCPSIGYTGPALMEIFWDTLYGSFVFFPLELGPASSELLAQGTVTGASGQVLRHQPVDLIAGTKTLHTYTDSKGKYVFLVGSSFSHPSNGTLSAMGVSVPIALGTIQDLKTSTK